MSADDMFDDPMLKLIRRTATKVDPKNKINSVTEMRANTDESTGQQGLPPGSSTAISVFVEKARKNIPKNPEPIHVTKIQRMVDSSAREDTVGAINDIGISQFRCGRSEGMAPLRF